ncbi:MAG: hypothetical protein IPN94_20910 [Sphingobacteriales bacterium]|nr:hypothetical protein [Sphingobacteriales bacterium]
MKQTYVTALLLWLMLAGVCRGQGKDKLKMLVAPQIAWDVYPLLKRQLGVGAGIYCSRQFSSKIGVKTGLIAMVQKSKPFVTIVHLYTMVQVFPIPILYGSVLILPKNNFGTSKFH